MATNSTHSKIKSTAAGGRDYSTIQAWEDDIGVGLGTSTNLVTDDYDHYGWISAEEFAENVTMGGHTTDSTHKIYLAADSNGATVTAAGHSHTKEDAALMDADRALTYNTSYASMKPSSTYAVALKCEDTHFEVSRIQFQKPSGNNYGCIWLAVTSGVGLFDRCLFSGNQGSATYDIITVTIISNHSFHSCLFVSAGSSAEAENLSFGGDAINCTFVKDSGATYSDTSTQWNVRYGRPKFQNCALFGGGAGSQFFNHQDSAAFTTLDYNCSDFSDLTTLSGEGANNVYSKTMSDQFQAVDNTDWRIDETGTFDLDSGGTDLTGTVPNDIFGNAFNAGDIGCQASSGGAPAANPKGPFGHPLHGPFAGPIGP